MYASQGLPSTTNEAETLDHGLQGPLPGSPCPLSHPVSYSVPPPFSPVPVCWPHRHLAFLEHAHLTAALAYLHLPSVRLEYSFLRPSCGFFLSLASQVRWHVPKKAFFASPDTPTTSTSHSLSATHFLVFAALPITWNALASIFVLPVFCLCPVAVGAGIFFFSVLLSFLYPQHLEQNSSRTECSTAMTTAGPWPVLVKCLRGKLHGAASSRLSILAASTRWPPLCSSVASVGGSWWGRCPRATEKHWWVKAPWRRGWQGPGSWRRACGASRWPPSWQHHSCGSNPRCWLDT